MILIIILLIIFIVLIIYYYFYYSKTKNKETIIFKKPFRTNKEKHVRNSIFNKKIDRYKSSFHFFIYILTWEDRFQLDKYVFIKGKNVNKAISIYLDKTLNRLHVIIPDTKNINDFIIPDIEINKWIHIAIIINYQTIDLFYKGLLVKSYLLDNLPIINTGDYLFFPKGGFKGLIYRFTYTPDILSTKAIYSQSQLKPL